MSPVHLLEALPQTPLDWESAPIALTASAVYEAESRGLDYRFVADIRGTEEFRARQGSYWIDQLAWFDLLDDLLCQRLPELQHTGLRPALLCGRWLKYALDIVFIRGCELSSVLQDTDDIDGIVLWRPEAEPSPDPAGAVDSRRLLFEGRSVYSRLLPMFAARASIPYVETVVGAQDAEAAGPVDSPPPRSVLRPIAGKLLRASRQLTLPRSRSDHLTLLLLRGGYDMHPLLTAARAKGHRCLLLDGDAIFDVSRRAPRELAALRSAVPDARFTDVAHALTAEDSQLWEWPDSWFGLPVSNVLRPRVSYFVERILPELVTLTDQFRQFYENRTVDYVVTPVLTRPSEYAAVEAARRIRGTQRVDIEHGDSALDASSLVLLELFQFDHYFSVSDESAAFFRKCGDQYRRPVADIHVGSYRWRDYQRLARRAWWSRPPARLAERRPTVVYAPTNLVGDQRYLFGDQRTLCPASCSDPWYYGLQRRLVDLFARDTRFNFVIKLFPGPASVIGPIDRYVAETDASHLHVSRQAFTRWLPWADRVILDYPSTPVYEAALAGVPFLSLLYDGLAYRDGALQELGPWTRWFHDFDDAERAVAEFLDLQRPSRPDLQPAGTDILEALEGLAIPPRGEGVSRAGSAYAES